MKSLQRIPVVAVALFVAAGCANGEQFAPLIAWRAAVTAGDKAALARLYSTNPPAVAQVGKTNVTDLADEWAYWAGLKSSGVTAFNPKPLDVVQLQGSTNVLLRIEATKAGQAEVASMLQVWARQPDGWRIIASKRTDFSPAAIRRLPEPATPNTNLYSTPSEARSELTAAQATAMRGHKRVLVVFGANWCYDCHVLDTTFRSKQFAPLVNANYVVVHINIGEEGKDNNDLAAHLGVALDRGIPSLAVLDPSGAVLVAQKGGEFESTVKIGPDDVHAFLEKWKPAQSLETPTLPVAAKAIEVTPNADVTLKYHFVAVGKQIYQCENGAWSKGSTPDATLYDVNSDLKIHHSAGPSWTMLDGSGSVKAIGPTAIHFAAPDGTSIDWLKLDVDKASRTGAFSDVGIIQRLYTGAGKAPSTACNSNQVYESPYTAHYYFWTSK